MYSHETKDASIPRERAGSWAPASGDSDGLCKTADADLCGFKQSARYKSCPPWTDIKTVREKENMILLGHAPNMRDGEESARSNWCWLSNQQYNSFDRDMIYDINQNKSEVLVRIKFSREFLKFVYNLLRYW